MKNYKIEQTMSDFEIIEHDDFATEIHGENIDEVANEYCEWLGDTWEYEAIDEKQAKCGNGFGDEYNIYYIGEYNEQEKKETPIEEYDLNYEQRKDYFNMKPIDYNLYLYKAINIISENERIDKERVCASLGMDLKDIPEFLEYYKDEKGVENDRF